MTKKQGSWIQAGSATALSTIFCFPAGPRRALAKFCVVLRKTIPAGSAKFLVHAGTQLSLLIKFSPDPLRRPLFSLGVGVHIRRALLQKGPENKIKTQPGPSSPQQ
jgi:hypothetical protein